MAGQVAIRVVNNRCGLLNYSNIRTYKLQRSSTLGSAMATTMPRGRSAPFRQFISHLSSRNILKHPNRLRIIHHGD
jgi:hypothetical protein